jgi:hypothetical protein
LLASGWTILVFAIFFGLLPSIAFPQVSLPSLSSRIVGAFIRTVTTIAIGSILWAKLGLFTWLTAVLVYLAGLSIGWMASHQWQQQAKFQQLGQQIAIATVDIFDRGLSMPQLIRWLLFPWRSVERLVQNRLDAHSERLLLPGSTERLTSGGSDGSRSSGFVSAEYMPSQRMGDSLLSTSAEIRQQQPSSLPLIILTVISTIAILGCTIWLRFEHPLTEFRFSHPDTYRQLLITQQILARDLPQVTYLPIFPSLAAFLAAMSGAHPLQVVHLLGAIVGTLVVLSIGYTIRCLTNNGAAALAATYSLGAYLFTWNLPISNRLPLDIQQCLRTIRDNLNDGLIRSWAVSELELGALFVILAIGCSTHIAKSRQRTEAIVNTICCVLLVAVISPNLLILVLFGGFGSIFGRQMALFTIGIAWTILGVLAAIPGNHFPMLTGVLVTLPIGLSLSIGLLFVAIAAMGRLLLASWSAPICLMVFIATTLNFCLPLPPAIDYLEYDAAARKAVEISHLFPHDRWTVVAPIEQLSQVYGRGWYEDAAQFTARYQDRVVLPSFHFPHTNPLLIFVEKRPFTTAKPEYPVPYSVLIDPTYRHYRSLSGRTQLATAMLQLCEAYRRHHPDLHRIYYESDQLRIYQFLPQPNDQ